METFGGSKMAAQHV